MSHLTVEELYLIARKTGSIDPRRPLSSYSKRELLARLGAGGILQPVSFVFPPTSRFNPDRDFD